MWFTDHQEDTKCLGEEDREREEKNQRTSKLAVLNDGTVLPCSTCASRHKKKELLQSLMSFTGRHKSICGQPKAEDTELVNELLCVCTVGSDTDSSKHSGQAGFAKLRLDLLPFPTPSSQIIHQVDIILC